MKRVIFTKEAIKSLRKHANKSKCVLTKIDQYAADPAAQANHVISLTGSDYRRLRVGDFRVIFLETSDTITIVDFGPRGGIYQ